MYYHEEQKQIFFAHPRTASKSTMEALYDLGFEQVGTHHYAPIEGVPYCEDRRYNDTPDIEECTTFCMVRNHYDAFVSWAHLGDRVENTDKVTLADIYRVYQDNDRYFKPRKMWPFTEISDHVLHFENFPECFHEYTESQGLGKAEVPHINSSDRDDDHYSEVLTISACQEIELRFGGEICKMGYCFE